MGNTMHQMRWQIASAYTLLILFTLTGLSAVLFELTRSAYLQTLEAGIVGQARLVAVLAEAVDPGVLSAQIDPLVDDLGRRLQARVTLIDPAGQIIADSLLPVAQYSDQSDRPEVRAALSGGQSEAVRYSTATGDDRFYVAVPLGRAGALLGVARVGVPLSTIAATQDQIGLATLATALIAALLAIVLAMLIARRNTMPLHELGVMAGRLAAGDLDARMPVPDGAEVAALAQSFNRMASRLRELIDAHAGEHDRLAAILATMDDGILILDMANRVTLANRAAIAALEISLPTPFALEAIAVGDQIAEAARVTRRKRDHESTAIEELVLPATGRSLRALITRLGGHPAAQILVTLQDLTELRRAERSRRLLLANITHDLRTPLASLQALLDALEDGAIGEPDIAYDFLGRMGTEVRGLSRLVDEFLELSRIELGQVALSLTPVAPHALLATIAGRMAAQADQKRVTISVEPAGPLPLISVDIGRMEQVLLNLLQNALAATPTGGQIGLSARAQGGAVLLAVRDTGRGIAPADLPHIFERFYKADPARSGGGAGLGLAIAKHLVERHGGWIRAESGLGRGTTLTISLPVGLRRAEPQPTVLL